MARVLIIHGPNLNLLGKREPAVYGKVNLAALNRKLEKHAATLKHVLRIIQSNHEGEIVEAIQRESKWAQALIINPAAYTHTSLAIAEAISSTGLPAIEVHISNIYAREEFRHKSFVAGVARGQIAGFGVDSYLLALEAVKGLLSVKTGGSKKQAGRSKRK